MYARGSINARYASVTARAIVNAPNRVHAIATKRSDRCGVCGTRFGSSPRSTVRAATALRRCTLIAVRVPRCEQSVRSRAHRPVRVRSKVRFAWAFLAASRRCSTISLRPSRDEKRDVRGNVATHRDHGGGLRLRAGALRVRGRQRRTSRDGVRSGEPSMPRTIAESARWSDGLTERERSIEPMCSGVSCGTFGKQASRRPTFLRARPATCAAPRRADAAFGVLSAERNELPSRA